MTGAQFGDWYQVFTSALIGTAGAAVASDATTMAHDAATIVIRAAAIATAAGARIEQERAFVDRPCPTGGAR